MVFPSPHSAVPALLGTLVLLAADGNHGLPPQLAAQKNTINGFTTSEIALSLVVNQMALLKILNDTSVSSLEKSRLQMMELDGKIGELKSDLQDMKDAALNEWSNITAKGMNEWHNITAEAMNEWHNITAEAMNEWHNIKAEAINEWLNITAEAMNEANKKNGEAQQSLQDMKEAALSELRQQQQSRHKTFRKYDAAVKQPQALEACKKMGGRLANPTNLEEDIQITREIGYVSEYDWEKKYWISGTDADHEGTWTDSTTGTRLSYINFRSGEPNNQDKMEHCLSKNPSFVPWNDAACKAIGTGYVCEYPNE